MSREVIETAPQPTASIIILHGLGADGDDFVPVAHEFDLAAVGPVRYLLPSAPVRPVTINNGYVMRASSVSLQGGTFDLSCCHQLVGRTTFSTQATAKVATHLMFKGHERGMDSFTPFIWHNIAFDPFMLSQPASQRAVRERLCGVAAQ